MQTNSNILLYAQAAALLQQLENNTSNGSVQSINDIATQLSNTITQYEAGIAQPILQFDKFEFGEPPLSSKINKMWTDIQTDINILNNQFDILRSAAIVLYNNILVDLQQATNMNGELTNLVSTLALYTNAADSKTFVFGDQFASGGFIDTTFNINDNQAQIDNGVLTLTNAAQNVDLLSDGTATVVILSQSNGFSGDNQEIEPPTATTQTSTTNQQPYTFVAQANNPNNPNAIIDGNSNTVFEYENYLVKAKNKNAASSYNFTYSIYDEAAEYPNAVNGQVDWSVGPSNGYLDLFLQIDLGSIQLFNSIVYSPYGLPNDKNYPVLIQSVSVSSDGTAWTPVVLKPVWVGTVVNQQAASVAANVSIGKITWNLEQQNARYIMFEIRQPSPISTYIGHLYYIDPNTKKRVEGPVPDLSNPIYYYTSGQTSINGLTQKIEYFTGQRWAIGINEISIQQNQYYATSTMVTKRIYTTGTIDRVALDADISVPTDFDSSQNWVTFWVSPDDGVTWYQISPIQDNQQGIPEIVAFNDPLPTQFQEANVTYATTASPVQFLRFKIQLASPATTNTETPVVKDYQLKIRLL